MRISDWSSDVCSSDLGEVAALLLEQIVRHGIVERQRRQAEPGSQRRADRVITAERYARRQAAQKGNQLALLRRQDRKSVVEGKSVSVRVDLGGRRILKKKKSIEIQRMTAQLIP